jgi:hypothetical protein
MSLGRRNALRTRNRRYRSGKCMGMPPAGPVAAVLLGLLTSAVTATAVWAGPALALLIAVRDDRPK